MFKFIANLFNKKNAEGWGYHLRMDVAGCDRNRIKDPEYLSDWVKNLVVMIDMEADGEPWIKHYDLPDPKLSGYTVFQMITTSNITCHFNDLDGSAFIDVFSCKEFLPINAVNHVREWFGCRHTKWDYQVRSVPK